MNASIASPNSAEARAEHQRHAATLVTQTWRVVAGPPGSPGTMTSVETPESLKRLGLVS